MKSRNYIYIVLVIIIIIFHEFILAMGYMIYTTSKYIVTDVIPETFNNIVYCGNNKKAYDKHIKDHYGIVADTFELKGHYSRFWDVSTPFMEKEFSIQVVKGKVLTDTFFSTLTTDVKFQHLYSEWVKKQVGIEDENVELKFSEGMYRGRMVGERPYVDFKSITSIDNLEEQVCEHIHNLYIKEIYINNYEFDAKENILNYANLIEEKIKKFVFVYNENISYIDSQIYKNQIYNFMFNNLIIYVNLFNNKDYYKIVYDYNYNTREYRKFYYDGSISTQWEKF